MVDKLDPMSPEKLRQLMGDRSVRAYLEQRRNERAVIGSRLGFALAAVAANRVSSNWAWLDQDRSTHRP
jgi:hypothetical protein